jgi:hypothetical protein
MALNNFVVSEQPPKWARRGSFREAGFYEGPAEMAKALLSGRWDFTPEQLYRRVKQYDDAHLVEWAKKNHVTMLRLVWSPGFSHKGDEVQWNLMRRQIQMAHRKRIKLIAYLSVTNSFWQEMFENEPASHGWRQVNHDGQDVPYMAATYAGVISRVLMCVNQQSWRDYIKYKITKALEAGADGLFFDNLFSKCYCPICRAKFADYTQSLYGKRFDMPAPEGVAHGPKDVGTKTGVEVVADSDRHQSELRSSLSLARGQFWNDSVADFMRELWEHAKAIRPDVVFYPNGHERWPMNVPCNFKLSEDQQPCRWSADGPMWTNVALWKYFYEDGGREKPAVNGAYDEVMWSEILAFGCDPIDRRHPEWNAWHAKYGKRVYAGAQPAGRVGLLMRSLSPIPEKSPAVTLLARKNVQFDVIVYEMMLDRYDLLRYELLLANDVRFMSDEACERIRQFVNKGGTLIATGQTSLFTEKWEPRGDYALADLFGVSHQSGLTGRFEKGVGKGKAVFYPQSVQDAVAQDNDSELLKQWMADVAASQKRPPLKVEAPDGLVATVWQRGKKRIVHLVNYRTSPVRDVKVTVPDAKAAKVELLSPEGGDLTARKVEVGADGVHFTVPQVGVYTVVIVG